ncbi:MAG: hypothetical protein GX633_01070 [Clostridiales bacterium]|nr:hypothetical protein [Clostridiales bacterium]
MLPQVDFLGKSVSRMIVGDNPINGHTYIENLISKDDMLGYYTENIVLDMMEESVTLGYNTWLPLGNDFMLRAIYHHDMKNRNINWIFQSFAPIDFEVNCRMMADANPLGIYHRGTDTDGFVEAGNTQILKDRIKIIKEYGLKAGLGTHVPETMLRAEYEDWGVDFYVSCLHNSRKRGEAAPSAFVTGKPKRIKFHMEDRPLMLKAIREVEKPVIAFKILAGGQIYENIDKSEYTNATRAAIKEAYDGIKSTDICCIGFFQRDYNQMKEVAELTSEILRGE